MSTILCQRGYWGLVLVIEVGYREEDFFQTLPVNDDTHDFGPSPHLLKCAFQQVGGFDLRPILLFQVHEVEEIFIIFNQYY